MKKLKIFKKKNWAFYLFIKLKEFLENNEEIHKLLLYSDTFYFQPAFK